MTTYTKKTLVKVALVTVALTAGTILGGWMGLVAFACTFPIVAAIDAA